MPPETPEVALAPPKLGKNGRRRGGGAADAVREGRDRAVWGCVVPGGYHTCDAWFTLRWFRDV